MWVRFDSPSTKLLQRHRRYAVLCLETIPSLESPCFDAKPSDSAYLAAGEIRRPSRPPARQSQTPESRAGSDNAGRGELSRSLGEVVLQRSFAVFSRRQISLPIPRPSKVYL